VSIVKSANTPWMASATKSVTEKSVANMLRFRGCLVCKEGQGI
jgi:hypothetical protein